jgi:deoxyribodipyrimidine photo-lyase
VATRAAALASLAAFLPRVPAYAARRSYVTANNTNVSHLSPYIRRRLISEQEVVIRVLERYPFSVAEKFIQEVVWRTYWKGWLEQHPEAWVTCVANETRYRDYQGVDFRHSEYKAAVCGETRLEFFNEWVRELLTTGYLHNHVRMWFASVWIFTLRLPWQLGAMFMYRNLLDGDPASNTLSWRWVAGLQTKGKSYLVRADNIAHYSEDRWRPTPGDLAETVFRIEEEQTLVSFGAVPVEYTALPREPYGVVTTTDDLSIEQEVSLCNGARSVAVLATKAGSHRELCGGSELVALFNRGSETDAVVRLGSLGRYVERDGERDSECDDDLCAWARESAVKTVVFVAPGIGPNRDAAHRASTFLRGQGIECLWYRRTWDAELHGLADRGFFPFWERVKKRIEARDPLFYGK